MVPSKSILPLLNQIGSSIQMDINKLISEGIKSLLLQKRNALMLDKMYIQSKYSNMSKNELEYKIELGEIDEHPAWEDIILLENIDSELEKFDEYIENISRST
jgi:hypothetical protein